MMAALPFLKEPNVMNSNELQEGVMVGFVSFVDCTPKLSLSREELGVALLFSIRVHELPSRYMGEEPVGTL